MRAKWAAMLTFENPINSLSAIGLALGALCGMAGTFVAHPHIQALLWAIDGSALVMAAALLTVKHFRNGRDVVAAGFLVFAIGEAVLMSGTAAGPVGSVPAFAAGTALWALALLLISIPQHFTLPIRLLGLVSAVLFAVVSARIFWGEQLLPTSTPLPFFAYPVLVLTFMGWIWSLWSECPDEVS
jgi:hypothetical protein